MEAIEGVAAEEAVVFAGLDETPKASVGKRGGAEERVVEEAGGVAELLKREAADDETVPDFIPPLREGTREATEKVARFTELAVVPRGGGVDDEPAGPDAIFNVCGDIRARSDVIRSLVVGSPKFAFEDTVFVGPAGVDDDPLVCPACQGREILEGGCCSAVDLIERESCSMFLIGDAKEKGACGGEWASLLGDIRTLVGEAVDVNWCA